MPKCPPLWLLRLSWQNGKAFETASTTLPTDMKIIILIYEIRVLCACEENVKWRSILTSHGPDNILTSCSQQRGKINVSFFISIPITAAQCKQADLLFDYDLQRFFPLHRKHMSSSLNTILQNQTSYISTVGILGITFPPVFLQGAVASSLEGYKRGVCGFNFDLHWKPDKLSICHESMQISVEVLIWSAPCISKTVTTLTATLHWKKMRKTRKEKPYWWEESEIGGR